MGIKDISLTQATCDVWVDMARVLAWSWDLLLASSKHLTNLGHYLSSQSHLKIPSWGISIAMPCGSLLSLLISPQKKLIELPTK